MVDIASISAGLKLADDGIWYSTETDDISYPIDGNDACFRIEDNSFWFRHRNNCIEAIVNKFPPEDKEAIFDIGGGNGYVSMGLAQAGFNVVLVEPGRVGAANARQRGLNNVICATTDTAKFDASSLPAVGLFDVIEHIEDDSRFLASLRRLVKKGGRLYATVPAYSALWSAEDIMAGHYRRYSLKEIKRVLSAAGFHVEYSTYIFRILPLPTLLMRTFPYRLGISRRDIEAKDVSKDHVLKSGKMSKILDFVLRPEIENLSKKRPMRIGGSCLIVAKAH